ncbi:hypothetical protein [Agrococcus sp. ProA11]|uniref:hypothetical protein n=1 Tax=Agrococcus chionoecetis TaxID=3153752 RepID=UPI003261C7A2
MARMTWIGTIAIAAMLVTGCAATAAPAEEPTPAASHTMPDGTVMDGAEHGEHSSDETHTMPDGTVMDGAEHGEHASSDTEPSEAAAMICGGQVATAVEATFRLDSAVTPSSAWDAPMFTCTYEIEGAPLELSVHDTTDVAAGEEHYGELQRTLDADDIEGLLGLGLPSFSNDEGIVAFLRDGKTLVVDATALPNGFAGDMTQGEAAYAIATAVLGCWVEHD